MCGVVGIASSLPVQREICEALTVLQHRGQDAAGMAVSDGDLLHMRKGLGLVRDVFLSHHMEGLQGNCGIGHVRYPTAGGSAANEAQPLYVSAPLGLCLAHNGNLINAAPIAHSLRHEHWRDISTGSDSEVLLNCVAQHLQQRHGLPISEALFASVASAMRDCKGAYAAVVLIKGVGLLAFRDPLGIRPLCIGQRVDEGGVSYAVASESAAMQALDFETIRDIRPGEAVLIRTEGQAVQPPEYFQCVAEARLVPCIFEWVYLARPDSILDGASVYQARLNMGGQLAAEILRQLPDVREQVDSIIPVPECSTASASQLAADLGIPYREAFVKNRYIGRTFIMPLQEMRRRSVRQKLNPLQSEFQGKSVLLLDDSIVRGTTSIELISQARRMGAKKVLFASAAPPVSYVNVFGIDMPTRSELIASGKDIASVCAELGADRLFYQTLEDLKKSVASCSSQLREFEVSIFTGEYPFAEVNADYLHHLAERRKDGARGPQQQLPMTFADQQQNIKTLHL